MENWGIYIHVPWCRRRCNYCDFYFEIGASRSGFAERIIGEYEQKKSRWPSQAPQTLYLGGGTPSLLEREELSHCLTELKARTGTVDWEVTLEANPEDLDEDVLQGLKEAGVHRLSLGIQSFEDDVLRWLGRVHTAADACRVLELVTQIGFRKSSVDLILGLPNEAPERVGRELSWLRRFDISHLSAYLLTVEENTPLLKQINACRKETPDPDLQATIYETLQETAPGQGLEQYEVSSWAEPGFESLHNRIYWSQGSYMGLGPGAHSCRLLPTGAVERSANRPDLSHWWTGAPALETVETLTPLESFSEAVAFGLRDMKRGIQISQLEERHRIQSPHDLKNRLAFLEGKGWLQLTAHRWHLTSQGALFADAVAREILC